MKAAKTTRIVLGIAAAILSVQSGVRAQSAARDSLAPGGDGVYHAASIDQKSWQDAYDDGRTLAAQVRKYAGKTVAGKSISIVTWFASAYQDGQATSWQNDFAPVLDRARKAGAMSLIKFSTQDPNFGASHKMLSLSDIAGGGTDGYWKQAAQVVKKFGGPVFISINHEMNGTWFPYSQAYDGSQGAAPKVTASDFVRAWQRIVGIFLQEGANKAIWVWSPNAEDVGGVSFSKYYPGDAYVDWVGASLYGGGPVATLDALYDFSRKRGKPIFITEWATAEKFTAQYKKYHGAFPGEAKWVSDFFNKMETQYKGVKGISWFQIDKHVEEPGGDFRLERLPTQARAYSSAVANPRYLGGAVDKSGTPQLESPRLESPATEFTRREVVATEKVATETVKKEPSKRRRVTYQASD